MKKLHPNRKISSRFRLRPGDVFLLGKAKVYIVEVNRNKVVWQRNFSTYRIAARYSKKAQQHLLLKALAKGAKRLTNLSNKIAREAAKERELTAKERSIIDEAWNAYSTMPIPE